MSKTPAQKRRRDFKTPEHWANWVCAVMRGNHGELEVNRYAQRSSTRDLMRGIDYALKRGLVRLRHGPLHREMYELTDAGKAAAAKHKAAPASGGEA